MYRLLRNFSICSAVAIVVITSILGYCYRRSEMRQLVDATQSQNVILARALANAMGPAINQHVAKTKGLEPSDLRALPETANWHEVLKRQVAGLPVLRVKIFSADATTLYSTDAGQIGRKPGRIDEFWTAVGQKEAFSKFQLRDAFEAFEGAVANRSLVSTYVPLLDQHGDVGAVLKVYSDVTPQVQAVSASIWRAGAILALAFSALYLTLFLVVRRADTILVRQYNQLENFTSTLETRVVERTAAAEAGTRAAEQANALLKSEIDQRRRTEQALQSAVQSLEAATQAKSQFLANMSHEIRTPMNGVFGMTELLTRTSLDDRQRRLVDTISQSARTLLSIINDILDLTRIEEGKLTLDVHEFELAACIEDAVSLLADSAHKKNIDLNLFIDHRVTGTAEADSGRLRQVLLNLIGNAVKFTSTGEVSVRVTPVGEARPAERIAFEVHDTGIGIAGHVLDKLFQPFTQADSSISRRFGGTGLGLSIARHLVAMMGGEIVIESKAGEGTRVSFELPIRLPAGEQLREKPCREHLTGQRILVVDDRVTNREIICSYLASCGAQAEQAEDAAQAMAMIVAAARQGKPFVQAIVDVVMPGIDGLELCRQINGRPELSGTQLILLSSISWSQDLGQVGEAGVKRLLHKPIRRNDLIAAVVELLTQHPDAGVREHRPVAARAAHPLGRNLAVLLAEDNPVNQVVATEYITNLGCHYTIVENGLQAVAASARAPFDIILMDCQMPEMDGLAATRQIRALEQETGRSRLPILALTANAYEEDRQRCLDAGMDGYLSKPFSEAQLAAAMAACLQAERPRADTAATLEAPAEPGMQLEVQLPAALKVRLEQAYLEHAPQALAAMVRALRSRDLDGLQRTAHALKSSSANLGATQILELCRTLETAARDARQDTCEALLLQLQAGLRTVLAELHRRAPDQPDVAEAAAAAGGA